MSKRDMRAKKLLLAVLLAMSMQSYYAAPTWAAEAGQTAGQTDTVDGKGQSDGTATPATEAETSAPAAGEEAAAEGEHSANTDAAVPPVTYGVRAASAGSDDYGIMPLADQAINGALTGVTTINGAKFTVGDMGGLAVGSGATIGFNGTVFGNNAKATNDGTSAFGFMAQATGSWSSAFGSAAKAATESSSAFGSGAQATGNWSSAFGGAAKAEFDDSVAIGAFSSTTDNKQVAFGKGTVNADKTVTWTERRSLAGISSIDMEGALTGVTTINGVTVAGTDASTGLTVGGNAIIGKTDIPFSSNGFSVDKDGALTAASINGVEFNLSASAINSVLIGNNIEADGSNENVVAIGCMSTVYGNNSVAIGSYAGGANYTVAVGADSSAASDYNTAIGGHSYVDGDRATGLGYFSEACYTNSVAIGTGSQTFAANEVNLGYYKLNTKADNVDTTTYYGRSLAGISSIDFTADEKGNKGAITGVTSINGAGLKMGDDLSIAFGWDASASGYGSVAIGEESNAGETKTDNSATAIGSCSGAYRAYTTAIGANSTVWEERGTALGYMANADKVNSVAIGTASKTFNNNEVNFGYYILNNGSVNDSGPYYGRSLAGISSIDFTADEDGNKGAITGVTTINGANFTVDKTNSNIAIGVLAKIVSGEQGVALGHKASVEGTGGVAVGSGAKTYDESGTALGFWAEAFRKDSIAIGSGAQGAGENSVAIGSNSKTIAADNSVAIGFAAHAADAINSIVIGTGSYTERDNQVNFGYYKLNADGIVNTMSTYYGRSLAGISSIDFIADEYGNKGAITGLTSINGVTVVGTDVSTGLTIGGNAIIGKTNIPFSSNGFSVDKDGAVTAKTVNGATITSTGFNGVTLDSGKVTATSVSDGKATLTGGKLSGLTDATLSTTSTDAVTGKQLNATNANVSAMDTAYKAADKALQDRATTLEGKTTNITYAAATGTTVDGVAIKAGVVTGVKSIDGIAIDSTTKNITNAGTYNGVTIGSGKVNGVTLDSGKVTATSVTDGKATLTSGKLSGLSDATLSTTSTDAVTGKQLNATNANVSAMDTAYKAADKALQDRATTLEGKTTNITYAAATGTTVDGVAIKAGVVTGVKSIDGIAIDSTTRNITNAGTYNSVTIGSGGINGVTINKQGGSGEDKDHVIVGGIDLTQLNSSSGDAATTLGGIGRTEDTAASGKHITTVEGQLSVYETGMIANKDNKFVVEGDKVTVGAEAADQTVIEKGGVTAKTVTTGKSVLNDSGLVVDTNTKVQSGLVQADAAHKLDTTGLTVGTNTLTDTALTIGAAKVESSGFSVGTTNCTKLADGTLTVDADNTLTTANGLKATRAVIDDVTIDGSTVTIGGTGVTTELTKGKLTIGTNTLTDTALTIGGTEIIDKQVKVGTNTLTDTALTVGKFSVTASDGSLSAANGGFTVAASGAVTGGTYNGVTIGSGGINDVTINKQGGAGDDKDHVIVGGIDLSKLSEKSGEVSGNTSGVEHSGGSGADGYTTIEKNTKIAETGIETNAITASGTVTANEFVENGKTLADIYAGKSAFEDVAALVGDDSKGLVKDTKALKAVTAGMSYDADSKSTTFSGNLVVGVASSGTHTQITDSAIIFGEGGNMQVTIDAGGIHVNQPTARGISTFADADGTHIDHNSLVTGTVTAANLNGVAISGNATDGLSVGGVNIKTLDDRLATLKTTVDDIQNSGVGTADMAGVQRSDADGDGTNDTTTIETATSFTKAGMKTSNLEAATAAISGVNFAAGGVVTGINSINGTVFSSDGKIGGVSLSGGKVNGVDVVWLDQRVTSLEGSGTGGGGTGGGGGANTSGIGKPDGDTTTIEGNTTVTGDGIETNKVTASDQIIVADGKDNQTVISEDGIKVAEGKTNEVTINDKGIHVGKNSSVMNDTEGFITDKGLYIGVNSSNDISTAKFSVDKGNGTMTSKVGGYTFTNGSSGAVFSHSGDTAVTPGGSFTETTIKGNKVTTGRLDADELYVDGNKVNIAGGTIGQTDAVANHLEGTDGDGNKVTNDFKTSALNGTTQAAEQTSADGKKIIKTENNTSAGGTSVTTSKTSINSADRKTEQSSSFVTNESGMSLNTSTKVTDKDGNVTKNTSGETKMTGDSLTVSKTTVTSKDGKEETTTSSTTVGSGEVTLHREDGSTIRVGEAIEGMQGQIQDIGSKVNEMGVEIKEVGALSAALAGLHPQPENANSRADFAMAMGSYEGKQALAVGGFYRPDKRTMLSIGASTTSSKHMMNMGISIALDRLPEEERKAQEAAAADPETLNKVLERLAALEQDNQRLQADNKKRDIAYEKLAADYTQLKEKYTEKTAEKQQSETKQEEAAPAEADSSSEE